MAKKTALIITAGLTVFILGAVVLAVSSMAQPFGVQAAQLTESGQSMNDPVIETLMARESQYQSALEEANLKITEANAAIAALQDERNLLIDQNSILLEREEIYNQAIAEANARLQELAAVPQVVTLPVFTSSTSAITGSNYSDDHDSDEYDEHDDEHEDHDEEEEWDDD